jgi:hypothetical protein
MTEFVISGMDRWVFACQEYNSKLQTAPTFAYFKVVAPTPFFRLFTCTKQHCCDNQAY